MSDTSGGKITGRCTLNWALKYSKDGLLSDVPHPWFQFVNDPHSPLTYILPDRWIQPANTFSTDFGSVPSELQSIVGPLDAPTGYLFHDSAFDNHGWWESTDNGKTWQFVSKTLEQVNTLLFDIAQVEGVDWLEREEMYTAVQLGGKSLWDGHAGPFPTDPAPVPIPQPVCVGSVL